MSDDSLWTIFINATLVNNFVLAYFLGICPFLGVSSKMSTATRMGAAVTFVMLVASLSAYGINALLEWLGAPYLRLISYIVVIASAVQFVEMFVKKMSPTLFRALGIFLPLITTNCAILGLALFQTNRGYNLLQCLVFAAGAGAGFTGTDRLDARRHAVTGTVDAPPLVVRQLPSAVCPGHQPAHRPVAREDRHVAGNLLWA